MLSKERKRRLADAFSVARLVFPESVRSFQRDSGMGIAAMLAFRGALALMPLLLLLLIFSSRVLVSSHEAVAEVERMVRSLFPQFAGAILGDIHALARQQMWGFLSLGILLWSVTPFADALRAAFHRIFRREERVGFLRAKVVDAATILVLLLVPVVLVGARILYGAAASLLGRPLRVLDPLIGGAAPACIAVLALALLYRLFAPVRVGAAALLAGSITAAALLFVMRPLFGWVRQFNPNYGYAFGSMKAAFLVLAWIQYLFAALLFGAEVMANVHRKDSLLLRRLFAAEGGGAHAISPLLEPFVRECRGEEILFREGDAGNEMYYVLSGAVTLTRDGETLGVMRRGDYFGEMSELTGMPRTATARAAQADTRLVAISAENLEVLLQENPSIVRALLVEMARRLRSADEQLDRK